MRVLSIDPGFNGAMAYLSVSDEGVLLHDVKDIPTNRVAYGKKARNEINGPSFALSVGIWGPELAIIEAVGARPGQGVTSMFRFGYGTGLVVGCCNGRDVPVKHISPQAWRSELDLTGWDKTGIRQWAQETYPIHADKFKRVKDSGRADAVAIGVAGIRKGLADG
jgi:crossover junction endodeoxyribonuclease RuvC